MTPTAFWTRPVSLLAIDPGQHTGWALFLELGGWKLSGCGVASPSEVWHPMLPRKIDRVVIEDPRIYPNGRARPNDILKLARVVGRYEERFAEAKAVVLVAPREWKGTMNADAKTREIERALTPHEQQLLSTVKHTHDTIDAIGLGKWALTQLKVMRAK